jgi:hypothetical protein
MAEEWYCERSLLKGTGHVSGAPKALRCRRCRPALRNSLTSVRASRHRTYWTIPGKTRPRLVPDRAESSNAFGACQGEPRRPAAGLPRRPDGGSRWSGEGRGGGTRAPDLSLRLIRRGERASARWRYACSRSCSGRKEKGEGCAALAFRRRRPTAGPRWRTVLLNLEYDGPTTSAAVPPNGPSSGALERGAVDPRKEPVQVTAPGTEPGCTRAGRRRGSAPTGPSAEGFEGGECAAAQGIAVSRPRSARGDARRSARGKIYATHLQRPAAPARARFALGGVPALSAEAIRGRARAGGRHDFSAFRASMRSSTPARGPAARGRRSGGGSRWDRGHRLPQAHGAHIAARWSKWAGRRGGVRRGGARGPVPGPGGDRARARAVPGEGLYEPRPA